MAHYRCPGQRVDVRGHECDPHDDLGAESHRRVRSGHSRRVGRPLHWRAGVHWDDALEQYVEKQSGEGGDDPVGYVGRDRVDLWEGPVV